ncbi:telomere-capping, CST complex subunit-domain-containing protein [Dichotomocladium elegans]|nr:telomere-capping, CST complex subunit-domain-containing protein [Dichotomocladium elegans]
MTHVPPGRLVLNLSDICNRPKDFIGQSVRIKGYLKAFDPAANCATIEFDQHSLTVHTDLLDAFPFPIHSLVEFIGEIEQDGVNEVRVRPRVARDMSTVDLELYEKAAECKLEYLKRQRFS